LLTAPGERARVGLGARSPEGRVSTAEAIALALGVLLALAELRVARLVEAELRVAEGAAKPSVEAEWVAAEWMRAE